MRTIIALTRSAASWHDERGPRPTPRNDRPMDRAADPAPRNLMATEPAARPTPALRRDAQRRCIARALRTHAGWHRLELPCVGRGHDLRRPGQGRAGLGPRRQRVHRPADGLRAGRSSATRDDRVDDYVNERMRHGVSFSLTAEDEVRAMELVCELTGWVDKARMTVSGTEATMHAMRVARAYTGRDKIVKFEGQYHGVHDYALISVSPGRHVRARRSGRAGAPGLGPGHPRTPSPTRSSRPATTTSRRSDACSSSAARRSPRSSSSPSSATPRGSCPSRASTRRCGP